jgi:hypothetical protein
MGKDPTVFITQRESACDECKADLGRHTETGYDALLAQGYERWMARQVVSDDISRLLDHWSVQGGKP